jgi:ATP adenylyltransferase
VERLSAISSPPGKGIRDPMSPPFDPHLHVCDLKGQSRHHLVVNKFMHMRGHLVAPTIDAHASQTDSLTITDCSAMADVLAAFDKRGVAYFNCGIESGCTQLHKHIQYCPYDDMPLFRAMAGQHILPIVYHSIKLSSLSSDAIFDGYEALMDRRKGDPAHNAYNFMVANNHAVLVPRRMARHPTGLVVNALGMCGIIALWEWSDNGVLKEPMRFLKELCIPK